MIIDTFEDEWIIVTPAETNEQRRIRKSQIVSYGKMSRYVYLYTDSFDTSKGYPIVESLEKIDRLFGKREGNPYVQNDIEPGKLHANAINCLNCANFNEVLDRCQKQNHMFDDKRPENYFCNKWKGR